VVSRTPDGKEVTLIQTIQHLGLEVADFTVDALDVRVRFELLGELPPNSKWPRLIHCLGACGGGDGDDHD